MTQRLISDILTLEPNRSSPGRPRRPPRTHRRQEPIRREPRRVRLSGIATFSFHYLRNGTVFSVFSVLTDGELWINYNSLSRQVSLETLQAFHRALHDIPGLSHIPPDFGRWPVAHIEETFASQPEALDRFKAAVEALGEQIHG